jgi:hypothetical protein
MSNEVVARLKRWEDWMLQTYGGVDKATDNQLEDMISKWQQGMEPPNKGDLNVEALYVSIDSYCFDGSITLACASIV